MPQPRGDGSVIQLPRWLYATIGAVIFAHFVAVIARVLAAMSGPWPIGQEGGSGEVFPPQFAATIADGLAGDYLKAVRLNRDYHFTSNRPIQPAYGMQAKLRDGNGELMQTLTFPDAGANPWVRHRQKLLVNYLANDIPTRTPQSEVIPPPGQKAPELVYWRPIANSPTAAELGRESVNNLPRGMMVFAPSEMEMLFVHAYVRHLRRSEGAAKVELIRVAQEPIPPAMLFDNSSGASEFEVRTFSYGDMSK